METLSIQKKSEAGPQKAFCLSTQKLASLRPVCLEEMSWWDQVSGLLQAEAGVSGCLPALGRMCTEGLG